MIIRAIFLLLLTVFLVGCATSSPDRPKLVSTVLTHNSTNQSSSTGEIGLGGTGKADVNQQGIGGTGKHDPDEGGIGGTGLIASEEDNAGGIGGTGKAPKILVDNGLGGTGIVGTITSFGSIWVNNAHIHFDEDTPVTINLQEADPADLRLGQVVAVLSDKDETDYQARSIDIVHEVVGPIANVAEKDRQILVMAQRVLLSDNTLVFDERDNKHLTPDVAISLLQKSPGRWIKVSGHRKQNGVIQSTRVDLLAAPAEHAQVIGKLVTIDEQRYEISGQPVMIDDWLLPHDSDGRILINGRLEAGQFIAENVGQDSTQLIMDMASEILIEGFVYETDIEDMVIVGGMEIEFDDEFFDIIVEDFEYDEFDYHEDDWDTDYWEYEDFEEYEDIDDFEDWELEYFEEYFDERNHH